MTRVDVGMATPTSDARAVIPGGRAAEAQVMSGMISSATMFATLIIGLIAGPAVSL